MEVRRNCSQNLKEEEDLLSRDRQPSQDSALSPSLTEVKLSQHSGEQVTVLLSVILRQESSNRWR